MAETISVIRFEDAAGEGVRIKFCAEVTTCCKPLYKDDLESYGKWCETGGNDLIQVVRDTVSTSQLNLCHQLLLSRNTCDKPVFISYGGLYIEVPNKPPPPIEGTTASRLTAR